MMMLLETYAAALIAALLIGVVVAYWTFRRGSGVALDETPPALLEPLPPAPPQVVETAPVPDFVAAAPPVPAEVLGVETPVQPAVSAGPPDDLQTMKGVGAKFAATLSENGFTRFDQIAALSPAEVADLDEKMGPFKGRLLRDRVVEQAGFLARGDRAGFEAAFGKLGSGA